MYFLIFFPFRVEFLVGTKMLLIKNKYWIFFLGVFREVFNQSQG